MLPPSTIPIPEKLRAFVRHIWVIEPGGEGEDARVAQARHQLSIYADGCPGIIFQQSEGGLLLNQKKELSPVFLYGQTVAPIDIRSSGRLGMVVVCFHPYALHCLFRMSAKELTDDCLDVSLLQSVRGRLLNERLWDAISSHEKVAVLFDWLEEVIAKNKAVTDPGMVHATARLLQSNGRMPLPALRQMLYLSPRTFERRFEQYIGVSPKLFSKIAQFQAALKHLQSGQFDKLSDIAYTYGYADQSHFIRNFSRFTGLSPLRWQKHAGKEGAS